MNKRMTWDEIKEKYPDEEVKITDVEWKPNNNATVKSAVVLKAGNIEDVDLLDALQGRCYILYTTPDNGISVGGVIV